MAEEQEETNSVVETLKPSFPLGRVKKIMKLDEDIKQVNSEALFLVALSTDLFLEFLAKKSMEVALEKKRKTIKLDYMRTAVKRHQPTQDFLLDSLPIPDESVEKPKDGDRSKDHSVEKPLPFGTRRIDDIFQKNVIEKA
ncbi:hypothetical protein ACHQM5_022109 [Ranunculus cassubicifolius]